MGVVSLSLQRRFSQTGTVWADLSTPASGGFGSGKHCGRFQEARPCG